MAVEEELLRRGWPLVAGPASANLLVVVGDPDPARADWAENLWNGVPEPKSRVVVREAEQATAALDDGRLTLLGPNVSVSSREEPRMNGVLPSESTGSRRRESHAPDGSARADRDGAPHHDHAEHETESHHGGHSGDGRAEAQGTHGGGHGHDMHAVSIVAGLPMADRAADRDGLRLDRLHVPVGPALLDWPAGLVLRLALQGDVVQQAEVDQISVRASSRHPFWNDPWLRVIAGERVERGLAARRLCAAHLDSVGRFLAVSGWDDAAKRARSVRRRVLAGASVEELGVLLRPWARQLRRSRTLGWLTRGLGELSSERAAAAGVTGPALVAGGDAYCRLLVWLDEIERAATACGDTRVLDATELNGPRGRLDGPVPPSQALLDVLSGLLGGVEFAGARIIVASLDPDLDELVPVVDSRVAHE
ncbi:hypothetical protein ACUN3E_28665 [Streptomyces sp. Ju416(a)]|uniref:hypothetical protein n=1 Tax=Streptomyces TaxID=1883 RepID=UPI0037877C75